MKRQTINIGKFEYVIDLYDVIGEYMPIVSKEYVILRNVSFIENVAYDTDVYFLEKSLYEEIRSNKSLITDKIVFPVHNSKFGSFSENISDFSNLINLDTFKLNSEGGNVFEILKWDGEKYSSNNVALKCDKIRIYHPHNKTDLEYIIYLDNTINGIHFHYFCDLRKNCKYGVDKQFTLHNIIYSEYVEFYIPNISLLFKEQPITYNDNGDIVDDNNYYFNDFYNITKYFPINEYQYNSYQKIKESEETWISLNSNNTQVLFNDVDKLSLTPFYLLLNPFISLQNNGIYEKVYFKLSQKDVNNYNSLPINITLYPYNLPELNNYYILNSDYLPNSDVFTKEYKFNLCSRVGFVHNQLCIISCFDFYNKFNEVTNPTGLSVQEAYALYNGLQFNKETNSCVEYETWLGNYEKWKSEMDKDSFDEYQYENDDEYIIGGDNIKCCGYSFEVATDFEFKHIIATEYIERDFIEDFDFPLVGLFDSWRNIPNNVLVRIKFIDKFLGIEITAGIVILNKEWLKYTINSICTPRLFNNFIQKQTDLTEMSWNTIDATQTNFNFIDKFNCIVDKKNDNENISSFSSNALKVIYKPIFYKAQDLQTLSLVSGLKQKVGINLADYMTKVSIFKLLIGGFEYTEYGRNDIYVIFEIDATILEGTTGIYNIVDSSDTFISSGNWYKK